MPKYNRLFVKMVRDGTRKSLTSENKCWVTGSKEELEIHHMYTLSALVTAFLQKEKISITDSNKVSVRSKFMQAHNKEIQEQVVLTKLVHKKLHSIFGLKYPTHLVPKVRVWLRKQREKNG